MNLTSHLIPLYKISASRKRTTSSWLSRRGSRAVEEFFNHLEMKHCMDSQRIFGLGEKPDDFVVATNKQYSFFACKRVTLGGDC